MRTRLTEDEYFDILETLPKENQYLDDKDPNKFVPKWAPTRCTTSWPTWTSTN